MILTTDHGLAFPDPKATMYDRGIGVMLVIRGPGGFTGGRVQDALVSQLDIYPTICELAGIAAPDWLDGTSLVGLVRGDVDVLHKRCSPRSPITPRTNRNERCGRAATSTRGASTRTIPVGSPPTSMTARRRTPPGGGMGRGRPADRGPL